ENRVSIQVRNTSVTVVDEPTETRIHLEEVQGKASYEGRQTVVEQLHGKLNGGAFRFAAQLDRTATALSLEAQFRADDVTLDQGMRALRYVVQVLAGPPRALSGRLHADFYVQGRGSTWEALSQSLVGQGVIALNPIDLDDGPLIAELSKLVE